MNNTEIATLAQHATTLAAEVEALTVTDATSFELAGEMVKSIVAYIKRVGDVLDPICAATDAAHTTAVRQRNVLLKPAKDAKRLLGDRMATWEQEQANIRREADEAVRRERERREAEARAAAAAEQRRLREAAETRRLEEAVALEAKGDVAGAERLIDAPVIVPTVAPARVVMPPVRPTLPPRVEGISFRDVWSAEVDDLTALVRAVAEGTVPITLVLANEPELNRMARTLKTQMQVPGVRVVQSRTSATRSTP